MSIFSVPVDLSILLALSLIVGAVLIKELHVNIVPEDKLLF